MKNRRERRAEARDNNEQFQPLYNGLPPRNYEDVFGVGYERFNNKFVTIKEVPEAQEEISE